MPPNTTQLIIKQNSVKLQFSVRELSTNFYFNDHSDLKPMFISSQSRHVTCTCNNIQVTVNHAITSTAKTVLMLVIKTFLL